MLELETLFPRASSLARLLEPPLGSYLESLAQRLQAQNYSLGVIRNYVQTSLKSGLRVKISRRFNSFGSGFLKPE